MSPCLEPVTSSCRPIRSTRTPLYISLRWSIWPIRWRPSAKKQPMNCKEKNLKWSNTCPSWPSWPNKQLLHFKTISFFESALEGQVSLTAKSLVDWPMLLTIECLNTHERQRENPTFHWPQTSCCKKRHHLMQPDAPWHLMAIDA